jgi:hypothetical protein
MSPWRGTNVGELDACSELECDLGMNGLHPSVKGQRGGREWQVSDDLQVRIDEVSASGDKYLPPREQVASGSRTDWPMNSQPWHNNGTPTDS